MKVRRELQEAKRRPEDPKQEAGAGCVKAAGEDTADVPSPLDSAEPKDTEDKDNASSAGKRQLYSAAGNISALHSLYILLCYRTIICAQVFTAFAATLKS